ncbi:HAMP domain-containing histidine kinase [Caproiciproducens sp. NJN-50]|uniref:sensor histidine kinase n=1 Tax=Acutalibacteraceae TaxID=3082771 RepID=UPI000FFDFFCF|nr:MULTISPECIES: HAMP domain-containing sensor histidine kinase [Acutalibacteraceae]QAT50964.1 HAMP domain-containing histidine kinase [Caproiciproducens sp. NJN-50]
MLIIILVILFLDSVILTVMRKNISSLLFFGLCTSLILMLSGIILYTAKIGGLSHAQYIFLFLSVRIQTRMQYAIITLDKLGYLIAVGRYLFPYFLLLISISYSTIPFISRNRKWMHLFFLPPAASLILYYPQVFYVVVCNRFALQTWMMSLTLVWILLYLAAGIFLMVHEYSAVPVAYFRRQFRNILILHISLAFLYGINCLQDPIQVYQLYGSEYLWVSGISYSNPAMPLFGWVLLTAVTIFSSFVGFWNLVRYTQVNYKTNLEDVVLQRKFEITNAGISVFVHSIKNQILSCGVVHKRIRKILDSDSPDLAALRENIDLLGQLNENMLTRINRLNANTKSHSIILRPVSAERIAGLAIRRFHGKYPESEVKLDLLPNMFVLADEESLSEALCNLLMNAQEAILAAGRGPQGEISLKTYNGRIYTFFEVSDNGGGISKSEQKKIFDPFYTTKNTNYNWGMGLHYVKRIAKSHFGMLRFESVPGHGSSFFLTLPRYEPRAKKDYIPLD